MLQNSFSMRALKIEKAQNRKGEGSTHHRRRVENVKRDVAFVATLVIQMVFPYIVSNF